MSKVERTPLEQIEFKYETAGLIAALLLCMLFASLMWGHEQRDLMQLYKGEYKYYFDKYHDKSRIIDVAPPATCKGVKAVDDLELQMRKFEQEVNKRRLESQLVVEVAQNELEAAKLRLEAVKLEK